LKQTLNGSGYLKVSLCHEGKVKTVSIHRVVAQNFMPNYVEGFEVDHIDRDRANNALTNLRSAWVSRSVNSRNKSKRAGTYSEHMGVGWDKSARKWRAQICIDRVDKNLGSFDDEEEAAEAYKAAVLEVEPPVERLDPILSMEVSETLTIRGVQYVIMEHKQEHDDEVEPIPALPALKPKLRRRRLVEVSEPDTESDSVTSEPSDTVYSASGPASEPAPALSAPSAPASSPDEDL
jgi:hypothetical protein